MLVNKRVTSGDFNILRFLFPNFDIITETNIPDNPKSPAIYLGNPADIEHFTDRYSKAGQDYIVMSRTSEIDLNDRRILANIIFEKYRNATLPKYLDEFIDEIPQDEFIEAVKIKWVTGRWVITEFKNEVNFLNLVESLNKSKYEFIKIYFDSLKANKPYILESSMLTFLIKAKNKTYKGSSFLYRKKLTLYTGKKLDNTLNAIENALEYNIDNPELRLLNLLISIQDSSKNSQ